MQKEYKDLFEKNPALFKKTRPGAMPEIRVNEEDHLTRAQIIAVLKNLRVIVAREELSGFDDTTLGNKSTQCTWGLCNESKELYPAPEMHIWPFDFLLSGRVAPLRLPGPRFCPLDNRPSDYESGCFYCCAFFQIRKTCFEGLSRAGVLERIDIKIYELETRRDEDA